MRDISIIYYTANIISDHFARRVRDNIFEAGNGIPIISVSQKPIDFGENICVGDIGVNVYNVYKQILIGAKKAKTKFVACCEDDSLYVPEQFEFEPPENTFCYNINYWYLKTDVFYYQGHRIMSQCVAPTDAMISSLESRFERFPNNESITRGFGEPGTRDDMIGLPKAKVDVFRTKLPPIVFRHRLGLSGVRKIRDKYTKTVELPDWGNALKLWRSFTDG